LNFELKFSPPRQWPKRSNRRKHKKNKKERKKERKKVKLRIRKLEEKRKLNKCNIEGNRRLRKKRFIVRE